METVEEDDIGIYENLFNFLLSFSLHDVDRQKIVTIDPVGSTWRPDVWFSRVMTLVVG